MQHKTTRREFMRQLGLASLGLMTPFILSSRQQIEAEEQANQTATEIGATQVSLIFDLGVASGDPSSSGAVLWTRVNPAYWEITELLGFQVALDTAFTQIVTQGEVSGADIGPEFDYTAKIDTDGLLAANQVYYYRFLYKQEFSQTGRCRTLPAANANPAQLKLGVVSCQSYKDGYYAAFHHLAQEDVDFVLHVGDFIYEISSEGGFSYPDRQIQLPSGSPAAITLEDYRYLYRLYRADPFLQEALAQHTFIYTWDDHETADNCYWDYAADTLGVEPDHPLAGNPGDCLQLKLDAQRAWSEYAPARVIINPAATHPHQYMTIWRSFQFGQLVEMYLTDVRSYRDAPPCGINPGQLLLHPGCNAQFSSDRSMLGEAQRNWLEQGILQSTALWKAWGNTVPVTKFLTSCPATRPDCPGGPNPKVYLKLDSWDGYIHEREQLITAFRNADVANLVSISGDLHAGMAAHILVNYEQGNWQDPNNLAGVEWVVPSVSSGSLNQILNLIETNYRIGEEKAKAYNPYIAYFDGDQFGYAVITFTPLNCEFTVYAVDKRVNAASTPKTLLKQLQVETNSRLIIPPLGAIVFINDLDGGGQNNGGTWTATVTIYVVDGNGNPIANATVEGDWSNGATGSGSGVTNANGVCTISKSGIRKNRSSVTFSVTDVIASGLIYTPENNNDPDGDSNGTTITILKP